MNDKIRELVENCKSRISDLSNMAAAELQKIKSESLGKNSELTNLLKSMRDIPAEERPRFGQMVNEARKLIEEAFADAERKMKEKTLRDKLEKERVEQEREFLPLLPDERLPRRLSVREHEGIVAALLHVFVVVVERVDEVHPLADGIEELFRRLRIFVPQEVRGERAQERRRGLRRLVGRRGTLALHRRLRADVVLYERRKPRILRPGALRARPEPRTLRPSAVPVGDVVGELCISEQRVEGAQLAGELVRFGDGALSDGVLETVLPRDRDALPRHVVQQRR